MDDRADIATVLAHIEPGHVLIVNAIQNIPIQMNLTTTAWPILTDRPKRETISTFTKISGTDPLYGLDDYLEI
jgi:hypothetical protein